MIHAGPRSQSWWAMNQLMAAWKVWIWAMYLSLMVVSRAEGMLEALAYLLVLEATFGEGVDAPGHVANTPVVILTIYCFDCQLTMLWCNFLLCIFFLLAFSIFCILFVFLGLASFLPHQPLLSPHSAVAAPKAFDSLSLGLRSFNLVTIVIIFSSGTPLTTFL